MTFSVVRQLAPGKECAATSAAAGGRSALYPWPLLLLSVSGLPFRVLEYCVALSLPCCCSVHTLPVPVSFVTASVRRRCWVGRTSIWTSVFIPAGENVIANVRCARTRWGDGGGGHAWCRRNTVISTFLNTWPQHVGARSKPRCVAASV